MCPRIVISSPPLCDAPVPPQSQTMATFSMSIVNHANLVLVKIVSSISIFDLPNPMLKYLAAFVLLHVGSASVNIIFKPLAIHNFWTIASKGLVRWGGSLSGGRWQLAWHPKIASQPFSPWCPIRQEWGDAECRTLQRWRWHYNTRRSRNGWGWQPTGRSRQEFLWLRTDAQHLHRREVDRGIGQAFQLAYLLSSNKACLTRHLAWDMFHESVFWVPPVPQQSGGGIPIFPRKMFANSFLESRVFEEKNLGTHLSDKL